MFDIKYRPKKFSEIIGNKEAISYFINNPSTEWPRTHLISGPSGVGKTTLARVISNNLCDKLSTIEIDTAQDRGIDMMRSLIKDSYRRPLKGDKKVYIFDEFHQSTKEAQQALLKITEEPPKGVYFIFCSTDPNKIVVTIRRRCHKTNLLELSNNELALILKKIAEKENIEWTETLKKIGKLIVSASEGSAREAVKLFERLYKCDSIDRAEKILQVYQEEDKSLYPLFLAVLKGDLDGMIENLPNTNFESVRIAIARMLANKVRKDKNPAHYIYMLSYFMNPIDSNLGDINLLFAFGAIAGYINEKR